MSEGYNLLNELYIRNSYKRTIVNTEQSYLFFDIAAPMVIWRLTLLIDARISNICDVGKAAMTVCGPGIYAIIHRYIGRGQQEHTVITRTLYKGVGSKSEAMASMRYITCCIVTTATTKKAWLPINNVSLD